MRIKDASKQNLLIKLIGQGVAEAPHERGGQFWCAAPQEDWAEELDVSVRTFRRMIQEPPIVREQGEIDGVKYALLRIGQPGEAPAKTPEHIANIMRKVWAEKVGTTLSPQQHGCLIGLAKEWPEGCQVDIFKTVLSNWSGFMAGVKIIQEMMAQDGEEVESKFFIYPSITVMRRFYKSAIELHGVKLQSEGTPLPPAFEAVYMGKSFAT